MCDMPHLNLELCAAVAVTEWLRSAPGIHLSGIFPSSGQSVVAQSVVAQSDLATAATTVVGTIAVAFAVLTVLGFALLARRARTVRKTTAHDELGMRADQLLVRLDDAIADSVEELGFAEAQFGSQRGAALEAAIASARALLTSAFSAKQRLDDQGPASATERRETNARITLQCETALDRLADERAVFDSLRGRERSAASDLERVRELVGVTRGRLASAAETVSRISRDYAPSAGAPISQNMPSASRLLDAASVRVTDVEARVDPAGAGNASTDIRAAERDAEKARQLLDAIDAHDDRLGRASGRLDATIASAHAHLEAARIKRDAAPHAAASSAIGDAIGFVVQTLAGVPAERRDPDASIARIDGALDDLDTALAGARSQQQRLDHAREALAGALLTAQSQIDVTRTYIAGRRGGAGAEARTRLAEAERLLTLASAESDPVIALDTARSSATYSRDADALARYDMLH